MSLITRCPACGTMFKVVPDQLRISEGWVRCGHCAEIFDATASLQGPEATALPVQAPAAPPVQAAVPFPVQAAVTEPAPIQQFRETEPPTQAPAPRVPAPSAPIRPAPEPRDAPDSIDAPPLYPSFPSEVHESELEREARHRDEEPDLDSVSFVRKARRQHAADHRLVLGVGQREFDRRHGDRHRRLVAQAETQAVGVAAQPVEGGAVDDDGVDLARRTDVAA
jgi:predicted Zn finger-like uncharacterized protein